MKVHMEQWEIERIKEKISSVLGLWHYDFIEANNKDGASTSMSKEEFFRQLETELKK